MDPYIDFAFLDSGTGGIPYMLALKEKSPGARCAYLGDSAHFPYGEKSPAEIGACAAQAIDTMIRAWNPQTIIIACNTISVTALADLRNRFPQLPIVGTVPAIRLAARVTRNRRIGFLATRATVQHPYSAQLMRDFAQGCQVFSRGDPDLVSFVEHRFFSATEEEKRRAVLPAVRFFAEHDCDTIILGCTHFTHIAREMACAAGPAVQVIDSRDGVAKQALKVEAAHRRTLTAASATPPDMSFFVTGYNSDTDPQEYELLCKSVHIPWGGLLRLGV